MTTEAAPAVPSRDGYNEAALMARPENKDAMLAIFRERSTLEALISQARVSPRNEYDCLTKMANAAKRIGFAEDAEFEFRRGKKFNEEKGVWEDNYVRGLSVYGARPIAGYWRNFDFGWTIVEYTDEGFLVEGYAIDMENGVRRKEQARGKWAQQRKNKQTKVTEWVTVTDERERREIIGKAGAIAERNCISRVIPQDIIETVLETCHATCLAADEKRLRENPEDTRRKIVMEFDALGVKRTTLETHLGHSVDTISAKELAQLKAIWRGIVKEGRDASEYFDVQAPGKEHGSIDVSQARAGVPVDPPGGQKLEATPPPADIKPEMRPEAKPIPRTSPGVPADQGPPPSDPAPTRKETTAPRETASDAPAVRELYGLVVDVTAPLSEWKLSMLSIGSKPSANNRELFEALHQRPCGDLAIDSSPVVDRALKALVAAGISLQQKQGVAPRQPFHYAALLLEIREKARQQPEQEELFGGAPQQDPA